MTSTASRPLNREFMGRMAAPAALAPSAATTQSAEFGAQTATRSPGSTPSAMAALATLVICASKSA